MIDLRITISTNSIAQMKLRLIKALPHVKSSHRVEALARGLGFRTYATLREATRVATTTAQADATDFCAYLAVHGFAAEAEHFYRAAASVAVSNVLAVEPRLSVWGYGIGRLQRRADGTRETSYQHHARFLEQRAHLMDEDALDQFLLALGLVQRIPATRTIRTGSGSYRLKHVAENSFCTFPCGMQFGPHYVANGALIVAALHAGFRYKTHIDELGYESINVTFNMSKPVIDDLDCEIRPNRAHARDRRRRTELRAHGYRYGSAL